MNITKKDINNAKNNDEIFKWNAEEQEKLREEGPWKKDPHYFNKVKLSSLALLKMVMHAASGGKLEIMGLMMGKIEENTMIVLDAFASPAKGSETRVNVGTREIEYISQFLNLSGQLNKKENCIGWYHSHPGYGCWLSGIDVNTQRENQRYQDPWLAIVIDPVATISSGRVEIGAFRTYPDNYTPSENGPSEYQTVPEDKIEDFGVWHKCYYKVPIELFKSSQDEKQLSLLWNKYWVNTLSSSQLIANRDFTSSNILDVCSKMRKTEGDLSKRFAMHHHHMEGKGDGKKSPLSNVNSDNVKLATEALNGLIAMELKKTLFNWKL